MLQASYARGITTSSVRSRHAPSVVSPLSAGAIKRGQLAVSSASSKGAVSTKQRVNQQPDDSDELDTGALLKYGGAVSLQVGIMTGALALLQQLTSAIAAAEQLPAGIEGADAAKTLVTLFFLVVSGAWAWQGMAWHGLKLHVMHPIMLRTLHATCMHQLQFSCMDHQRQKQHVAVGLHPCMYAHVTRRLQVPG